MKSVIAPLEQHYQISPDASVFIAQHPDLVPILEQAVPALRACFGQDVTVSLVRTADYDAPDAGRLFGHIYTHLPVDEALAALDTFDEQFLLQVNSDILALLNFNLRFR